MQANATAYGTFAKNSAIGPYLRVVMSSGNLALAGANDREFGVTKQRVLASGLGAGDEAAVTLRSAEGTTYMIAAGAVTQFAKVYGAASGKVSATANGNFIGWALTAATADGDQIEVLRGTDGPALLYSQVAAGNALTNSTTETALGSYAIPANTLKAGDVLKVRYQGIATATNSTDTLTVKLYVGGLTGTAILTGTATDVANNNIFTGEALVQVRTAGASGTFVAVGSHAKVPAASGTASPVYEITASTSIDTTAAQTVAVGAAWSVASASNSCRLDILAVERVPA